MADGRAGFRGLLALSEEMTARHQIRVHANDELVLDAGTCEQVSGPHGPERLVRPPETTLFHQVLSYLSRIQIFVDELRRGGEQPANRASTAAVRRPSNPRQTGSLAGRAAGVRGSRLLAPAAVRRSVQIAGPCLTSRRGAQSPGTAEHDHILGATS